MHVLSRLGRFIGPILGIYLAFKIGDMVIRETYVHLTKVTTESVLFFIELVVGVIIPLRLSLSRAVLRSPVGLFVTSALVIFGVLLNRINNFIVAYTPPYTSHSYFPSFGEISVTVGFVALIVLLYRFFVLNFPIISLPDKQMTKRAKYAIRGTTA
jgi:Ni/Fe-hydrogenase subunit HybB-like protein